MKCEKCGTKQTVSEIKRNNFFCVNCGCDLEEQETFHSVSENNDTFEEDNTKEWFI